MPGPLYQYLSEDHKRLDALLQAAAADPDRIDTEPYALFRKGLLRHIGIEERIVFPAITRGTRGEHKELLGRLRLDHGALASLLVPSPSRMIVATLRTILKAHNPLEEGGDGLYQIFEQVTGSEVESELERLVSAPEVPVMPHNDKPGVLDATRRAVERAGYGMKSEL